MSFLLTAQTLANNNVSKHNAMEALALFWRLVTAKVRTHDIEEAMMLTKRHLDKNYIITDLQHGKHLCDVKMFNHKPFRFLGKSMAHIPGKKGQPPFFTLVSIWADAHRDFDVYDKTKLDDKSIEKLYHSLRSFKCVNCTLSVRNLKKTVRFMKKRANKGEIKNVILDDESQIQGVQYLSFDFVKDEISNDIYFLEPNKKWEVSTYEDYLKKHGAGDMLDTKAIVLA